MARLYRKVSCENNTPPIFYLPPTIYQLKKPFKGIQFIYAEPEVSFYWKKTTNNYLYREVA